MNSCQTCRHWHTHRSAVRHADAAIGECHATPPARDFTWHRTKATDTCGNFSATVAFATATKPFDASRTAGPGAAVAAPTPPSTASQTADLALGLPARIEAPSTRPATKGLPGSRQTTRKPTAP